MKGKRRFIGYEVLVQVTSDFGQRRCTTVTYNFCNHPRNFQTKFSNYPFFLFSFIKNYFLFLFSQLFNSILNTRLSLFFLTYYIIYYVSSYSRKSNVFFIYLFLI
ncbi:hypothetical protein V8G54_029724 [Vigna mungo]|uniref:Uncharacterized protein n=1 Tax=Vigna mungo TaxID=3915 RepID=A0AAQ3RM35_VIGMU